MHVTIGRQNAGDQLESYSVAKLGLVDVDPPEEFDALTRLAMRLLSTPVALVSIVQEEVDRQYFTSAQGLPEPWASKRQTPLSHSFCRHVKRRNAPLIVRNAFNDMLVCNNPAVVDLDVKAYLGVPISGPDGNAVGALCVIDAVSREWTDHDLELLTDLARCVSDEILLRAHASARAEELQKTLRYNALRESISLAFMAPDMSVQDRFTELLRSGCMALQMESAQITKVEGGRAEILFAHGMASDNLCGTEHSISETLTGLVTSGQQQIYLHDLKKSNANGLLSLDGQAPRCYAGTPLIFDGVLYGTLEFFGGGQKADPWSDEELSMLSIISMFACAHLGVFGQIRALQSSEAALMQYLVESRNERMEPMAV